MEEFLYKLLLTMASAGLPLICIFLVNFLRSKQAEIVARINNAYAKKLFEDIMDIIVKSTQCTTQTFVDDLKNSGDFTKESAEEAFGKTFESVQSLLTDEMTDLILEKYGDLDTFLKVQIEAMVQELKNNKK